MFEYPGIWRRGNDIKKSRDFVAQKPHRLAGSGVFLRQLILFGDGFSVSFHVWFNIDCLSSLIVSAMSADAPGFRQSLAGFAAESPRQFFIWGKDPDAVKRNDTWGFPGRLLIRGNLFPAFPYVCFIFHFLMTEDIFTSEVERFVAGRKVSLIWASPDCTHFSKAKGKTPRKQGIRMLPYAVYFHAAQIHPEVICMENVAEIQGWCPIEDREDVSGFGQPGTLRRRLRCPDHKKALVCSDPKQSPCDTMAKTHQQQNGQFSFA